MDKIPFTLGLLRLIIDALGKDSSAEVQSVIESLNTAYDKLVKISPQKPLAQEKTQGEQSVTDDTYLKEMADKFVDPSQNPVMKEVRDSIDHYSKIKKANDDFHNEFMKANDQVKQEEIVNSLTTALPQ